MAKKLNINDIRLEFEKEGYKLITEKYINNRQKLKYICPNGHKHSMRIDHWRKGVRCPYCSGKFKKSIEYIKPFFESEGYVLLSNLYVNAFTKLKCRCPIGHIFFTSWHNWNNGRHRCPVCNGGVRIKRDYVSDVFEDKNYRLVTNFYFNSQQKLHCICPNGHDYYVNFSNFSCKGSRCPKCSGVGRSSYELQIQNFFDENKLNAIYNDKNIINPYELDIVIPDKKTAIEFCGLYWHSELAGKDKNYHLNKLELCNKKGYGLVTVFEDEFIYKKDIVFSILSNLLNLNNYNKIIYGRQCKINILSSKDAAKFFNENHIQSYGQGAKVRLGAFYKDELVSAMTFSNPSIAKGGKPNLDNVWELNRFCSKINYRVIGIASKLLKYFERNYKWNEIFSYADRRWFDGGLYNKLGFNFYGNTSPNYWYFKNKKRVHRFALRKKQSDPKDYTEWQLRVEDGWNRIWDCGNLKYKKEI